MDQLPYFLSNLTHQQLKIIVQTRGIHSNKFQSNILKMEFFSYIAHLVWFFDQKVKFRKNWFIVSKNGLHHDFFQIFSPIKDSVRHKNSKKDALATRPIFYDKIEDVLLDCLQKAISNGELGTSQRQGVISFFLQLCSR